MVSIIVFSKGRPMQLHAYLESLLFYSEVKQEMIDTSLGMNYKPNIDSEK